MVLIVVPQARGAFGDSGAQAGGADAEWLERGEDVVFEYSPAVGEGHGGRDLGVDLRVGGRDTAASGFGADVMCDDRVCHTQVLPVHGEVGQGTPHGEAVHRGKVPGPGERTRTDENR